MPRPSCQYSAWRLEVNMMQWSWTLPTLLWSVEAPSRSMLRIHSPPRWWDWQGPTDPTPLEDSNATTADTTHDGNNAPSSLILCTVNSHGKVSTNPSWGQQHLLQYRTMYWQQPISLKFSFEGDTGFFSKLQTVALILIRMLSEHGPDPMDCYVCGFIPHSQWRTPSPWWLHTSLTVTTCHLGYILHSWTLPGWTHEETFAL